MNNLVKATIPAAGESVRVQVTGKTIYFLGGGSGWNTIQEAATITFEDQGVHFPAYAGNKWAYSECEFQYIILHGTAETAGGVLYMQGLQTCEQSHLEQPAESSKSIAGETNKTVRAASDAVQSFNSVNIADANGNLPKRAYIWVVDGATRGINYAFVSDPSQGFMATDCMYFDNDINNATGSGDIINHNPLEIEGIDWILNFNYIAAVAGETPNLVVTFGY